jgi:nucleoid-associated protein YgaU
MCVRRAGAAVLLPIWVAGGAGGGALLSAAGAQALRPAVAAARDGAGPSVLGDLIAGVAAIAAGVLLFWLALGAVVQAADVLRTRRGLPRGRLSSVAARTTPALTRRLVASALGAGVVCGTALPASALTLDPGWSPAPAASTPADGSPQPLATAPAAPPPATPGPATTPPATTPPAWQPTRPAEPAPAVDTGLGPLSVAPRERAAADEAVVVLRGDTLWDIAARHLPAGAGDVEVAVEWPLWYAANAAVIGADPDHIEPGMRLVPPPGNAGSGS